jgi:hypothetical protein
MSSSSRGQPRSIPGWLRLVACSTGRAMVTLTSLLSERSRSALPARVRFHASQGAAGRPDSRPISGCHRAATSGCLFGVALPDLHPTVSPAARSLPLAIPDSAHDVACLSRTLCEVGRVEHLHQLGTNGPLRASAGPCSLFNCLFGRDAIRMAMDLLEDFPACRPRHRARIGAVAGFRLQPAK